MSITDELREWVTGAKPAVVDGCSISVGTMTYGCKKALLAIADRIDAEHEAALLNVHIDLMDASGWVRLPKDADGEYIHFGDVLDQFGTPMTVYAMSDPDPDQGDCMLELITDGISDSTWVRARKMRHYHAPTVEDVLREFAYGLGVPVADSYVAACAAKLQLREDA